MSITTRAALLKGPRDIDLIEKTLVCGDSDVIVKNQLVGICGTDKAFYRGQMPEKTAEFRHDPVFPFPLGHESGGIIVEAGAKVTDFKVGDKVIAFGWNNNFADYFVTPTWQLQPAPEGLEMDFVALGEPISCAMHSGLHCGVQLGDVVLVMGAGFAGQVIAQCAKKKGAKTVIVADVLDGKLELAKKLGADVTLNLAKEDGAATIFAMTGDRGVDVVVEAAGGADSYNLASKVLKHNGKFVFYSWVTQPITLNISRWHDDGLEFINTCLVHHTWRERYVWAPQALRPVVDGIVDVRSLITHEFKLDEIKQAFDLADRDDTAIKIVLRS